MNISPPTEHQLLVFWVALFALLLTARVLGMLARRVGQPAVVGELAAGLVLGPSLLGRVLPDVAEWLFPDDDVQTGMLFTVGWIGVVFLLVATGYETDLGLIRRLGRAAGVVSAGSLLVPIVAGFAVGSTMPVVFLGENGDATIFALFMAAALSISSLPVIAKILGDMGFMRRNFGQLTLAAGMVNDVVGWIMLGVIAGLAQAGAIEFGALATTITGVALFFLLALTVGQRFVDRGLRRVRAGTDEVGGLSFIVLVALALGAITQTLGVEAVLGAFVAGVLFSRSPSKDDRSMHRLEHLTGAFLAPVFFATAGLQVDLGLLADGQVLLWAVIVVAVASLSKFFGALIGARVVGLANREGAALGVGLNARGALEIVIATVGLGLGVLNQASYTVVVLMAVSTSMMAPPMLRAVLSGWAGTSEEMERLEREEALRTNVVVRDRRVLLPSRGGPNSIVAAQVLDLAWPEGVPATLLTLQEDRSTPVDVQALRNVFADRALEHRVVQNADPVEAILAEAKLGYGAIGIGATDHPEEGFLLSPIVDQLLLRSSLPITVVRRSRDQERPLPWAFSRAVVPVSGTNVSKAAQEVAYNLSRRLGTEIVLAHVVTGEERVGDRDAAEREEGPAGVLTRRATTTNEVADRLLSHAEERGEAAGARVRTEVREGDSGPALLRLIEGEAADLVILGVNRRPHSEHLFLGHTVAYLLDKCDTTLVLVAVPNETPDGA